MRQNEMSFSAQARVAQQLSDRKGHDRFLVRESFLAVADGATPLAVDWRQDVGKFAEAALDALYERSIQPELPMREVWRGAIADVRGQFGEVQPFLSCSVAMVRRRRGRLELATLGDCGILAARADGSLINLVDSRLRLLDSNAKALGDPCSVTERLILNRKRMNKPDGYWTFSTDPAAVRGIEQRDEPESDIRSILLYTDGFYRVLNLLGFPESDPGELLKVVGSAGVGATLETLRRLEREEGAQGDHRQADLTALDGPDDATAIYLEPLAGVSAAPSSPH
jgi:hypothetical protein